MAKAGGQPWPRGGGALPPLVTPLVGTSVTIFSLKGTLRYCVSLDAALSLVLSTEEGSSFQSVATVITFLLSRMRSDIQLDSGMR